MRKTGIAFAIFAAILLLVVSGCQPETVTTTVNTTSTLTQSSTVTQTQAATVTVTSTVLRTVTTTQTATSTTSVSASATVTTTTSSATGFQPVTSPDGKLQIVSAQMGKTGVAVYQVVGQVLNLSNEILNARITVEFIKESGGIEQTRYTTVSEIQPGQQKTFTVSTLDTFSNCTDFNISVEVWQ
jgi:energy-coupling factor transporter transmembrane protein EcfT